MRSYQYRANLTIGRSSVSSIAPGSAPNSGSSASPYDPDVDDEGPSQTANSDEYEEEYYDEDYDEDCADEYDDESEDEKDDGTNSNTSKPAEGLEIPSAYSGEQRFPDGATVQTDLKSKQSDSNKPEPEGTIPRPSHQPGPLLGSALAYVVTKANGLS